MIKKEFLTLLIIFTLISCDSEYTYDVRVVNNTGQAIKVDFKSDTHIDGPVQNHIFLDHGTSELIISTKNLDKNIKNVCDSVAAYVRASTIMSGQSGSLKWCDPSLKPEVVDIGQYQYVVEYKKEHFEK